MTSDNVCAMKQQNRRFVSGQGTHQSAQKVMFYLCFEVSQPCLQYLSHIMRKTVCHMPTTKAQICAGPDPCICCSLTSACALIRSNTV